MALNNPKPKYVNGSKYPNATMTDQNNIAGTTWGRYQDNDNKQSIVSTASVSAEGPKVINNLGSGPKGQRSKMQIKKVPFKGVF